MNTTKIKYLSAADFYDGVLALTERGLVFEADFASLTLTLNGGF